MIRVLVEHEVRETFLTLVAQIESGASFDHENLDHGAWLMRKIARRMGAGAQFYGLFLDDGTPVGLSALIVEDHPMYAGHSELVELGVFEPYRKQGHGVALLSHAEQISRALGLYCMYISTYAGDTDVIAFYGKRGFVPVATLPDLNGPDDEGQIYMRKLLLSCR